MTLAEADASTGWGCSRRHLRGTDLRVRRARLPRGVLRGPGVPAPPGVISRESRSRSRRTGIRITGSWGFGDGMHRRHLRRWHGAPLPRPAPGAAANGGSDGAHRRRQDRRRRGTRWAWPGRTVTTCTSTTCSSPASHVPVAGRHSGLRVSGGDLHARQLVHLTLRRRHPSGLAAPSTKCATTSCAARPTATTSCCSRTRPTPAEPGGGGCALAVARACARRSPRCGLRLRGKADQPSCASKARVAAVTTDRGAEIVRTAYEAAGANAVRLDRRAAAAAPGRELP